MTRLAHAVHRDCWRVVSVPGPWVICALLVVSGLSTVVGMSLLGQPPPLQLVQVSVPTLAAVFGSLTVGADLRHGTWHVEVLLLGSRWAHWARSSVATGLVACVMGALAGTVGLVAMSRTDAATGGWWAVVAVIAGAVAWSLIGAAVTTILGSQFAGVTSVVMYAVLVETILEQALTSVSAWLPARAYVDLLRAAAEDAAIAPAVGHLAAVAGAMWLLALVPVARRPIPVTPA